MERDINRRFRERLARRDALIVPGAANALAARVIADLGFEAVYVTGAGITNWISDYGTADIPRTKESEFTGPPWDPKAREILRRQSPIEYVANIKTPTMFLDGESDHRVPIAEAEQMYTALRKLRVPARMVRYPDSYYGGWSPWNMVHRYNEELKWWRRYLDVPRTTTSASPRHE